MRHVMVVGAILAPATLAVAQCPPQHLIPPTPWMYGDFGRAVSMDGPYLVVGDRSDAELCPVTQDCGTGAAHIYTFDSVAGEWTLRQTIRPALLDWGFGFGWSVAIKGDRLIAGARGSTLSGTKAGAAYVFDREGDTWFETGQIVPAAPVFLGEFGHSVAIDGALAVVGQPRMHGASVYVEGFGGWGFRQRLAEAQSFGHALALSEDWLIVGAPEDATLAHLGGAVFTYRRGPGAELTLTQKLTPPDVEVGPEFGNAVSLDGATLAVGGPRSDRTFEGQGAVYIFELADGDWTLRAEVTHENPLDDDFLGAAVALSGDILVAGAPRHRGLWPDSGGAAYVFTRRTDGSWAQAAELMHGSPSTGPFGGAVAAHGRWAAVGSYGEATAGPNGGAAYIFDLDCLLACPADLDGDGELTFFDFLAFGNLFSAGDLRADFDGSGALDLFDFLAFQTAFAAGCP
ncbi:MAG: GC-type dockerin domain-anchored protein [Phycisphaerales bacterium JB039]